MDGRMVKHGEIYIDSLFSKKRPLRVEKTYKHPNYGYTMVELVTINIVDGKVMSVPFNFREDYLTACYIKMTMDEV